VVICLDRVVDLHMAQLMPLTLTVSCSSKIQIGFTFLVPANPGSPRLRAVKRVCVCVCGRVLKKSGQSQVHNWTDTDRQQVDCQLIITVENYTTELNVLS